MTTKDAPLPFGLRLDLKAYRVFARRAQDGSEQVCATLRETDQNAWPIIISPAYDACDVLPRPVAGKDAKVRLWTVVTDLDRLRSREVVHREHYLSDPGHGMILACAFVDGRVQENARKRAARRAVDAYKISWHLPPGGIVGCAIVGTMWHGNPRDGRQLIAAELGVGSEWWSWKRPQIIQKFRVAWASRFAVDEPYQGLGIGTLLARHLKLVTRRYRLPCTDFLEVITTEERPVGGASLSRAAGGFLVAAGYTPLDKALKSDSMKVMNLQTGFRIPQPAIKRYYVADLREI